MKTLEYGKFYDNWIAHKEKKNFDNYKVIELNEVENSRKKVEELLKKVIIKYYIVPKVFEYHKSQVTDKFNSLEYYLSKKIPEVEKTRKGEFGEIFGTEFLKQKCDYHFPVNKLNKKENKDVPAHGEDILGFKYDDDKISRFCICECKTAKQYKTDVLKDACTQLKKSNIDPKSLIRFHEELWESNQDLAIEIFNAMQKIPDMQTDNWIFYIIERRSTGIFKEQECLNSLKNLKLVYFNLKDLTDFVNNLYDNYGDIFDD